MSTERAVTPEGSTGRAARRALAVILGMVAFLGGFAEGSVEAVPPAEADGAPEVSSARGDAYWHLARAFYVARRHHRADEAVRDIRAALALEPESAELKAEAAALLVLLGRRGEAETVAREALALDPEQRRALRTLAEIQVGKALSASNRTSAETGLVEAIDLFGRLTAGDDPDPDDLLLLARLQNDIGRFEPAVETARRLTRLEPGDWEAVEVLFRSLLSAGRGVEAVASLLDYLERNPSPITGLDLEGFVSDLMRRTVEEENAWAVLAERGSAVVAAHPEVAALRSLHGEALLRQGRNVEAIGELERAVELADGPALQLEFYLAAAYASSGRLADALELAQRLLERAPGNVGLLSLLGETYSLRGQVDEAVETLEAAIEVLGAGKAERERRDELRSRIAAVLLVSDRAEEAAAVLEGLEGGVAAEELELSTRVAVRTGDDRAARRQLRRLRELGTAEGEALAETLEAELLARDGRISAAKERLIGAAEVLGPGVLARGAALMREFEQPSAGEELLRVWVEREPESARAHFRLGAYLERSGRFDEAVARLERSLELDSDDAEVLNYLGYSLADRDRDLDRALVLIERALAIDPWNGAFLDSLGWVYYRLGRFLDARAPLESAAREYPHDVTVLDHLGDLYVELDEPGRAIEMWERALVHADAEAASGLRSKISSVSDRADLATEAD